MNQSYYEQLKSVIQAANPEIMELKMGCEVTYGSDDYYVIENNKIYNPWNGDDRSNLVEIHGRPIRLADVLLAFEESGRLIESAENEDVIGVDQSDVLKILRFWNVADDNLDHQTDECKQFLIDLLTKQL